MADANGTGLTHSPPEENDDEVNNSINPNPDVSSSETQGRTDDTVNLDSSGDPLPASLQAENVPIADAIEARIPQKKDATLKEFLGKMEDYAPIVCSRSSTTPRHYYASHM